VAYFLAASDAGRRWLGRRQGVETGHPVGEETHEDVLHSTDISAAIWWAGWLGTRFDSEPYAEREGALWEIIVLLFEPKQGS